MKYSETLPTPFERVYLAWVSEDEETPTDNKPVDGAEYVVVIDSEENIEKRGFEDVLDLYWNATFIPLTAFDDFTNMVDSFERREMTRVLRSNSKVINDYIIHQLESGRKSIPDVHICPICNSEIQDKGYVLSLGAGGPFIHYDCTEEIKTINRYLLENYSEIILSQKFRNHE